MDIKDVKIGRTVWSVDWAGDVERCKIESEAKEMTDSYAGDSKRWVCRVRRLKKDDTITKGVNDIFCTKGEAVYYANQMITDRILDLSKKMHYYVAKRERLSKNI